MFVFSLFVYLLFSLKVFAGDEVDTDSNDAGTSNDAETDSLDTECSMASFPVQEDFNPIAFQGHWHVISMNRFWITLPILDKVLAPKNAQIIYKVNDIGDVNVTACGSIVGPFCDYMTGYAEMADKTVPQKMNLQFDTLYLPAAKPRPYWVISTDNQYAVVYSCFDITENGSCNKDKVFLWTLNRNPKGHTDEQKTRIEEAVKLVCITIGSDKFLTIKQDGGCDISTAHLHTGPGLIFVLVTVIVGFFMILICCTCCLSKGEKISATKKNQ